MYMDALWAFTDSSDALFDCELIIELVDEALIPIAPEFAIGDSALEGPLLSFCQDLFS